MSDPKLRKIKERVNEFTEKVNELEKRVEALENAKTTPKKTRANK